MTANGWAGYWVLTALLLVAAGAACSDVVWRELSRFGRTAAWMLGAIADARRLARRAVARTNFRR